MQFESDLVGSPIRIASNDEMSGLGAAWACGIALGMYTRDVVDVYGARDIVEPAMPADVRAKDRRLAPCREIYNRVHRLE